MAFNPYPVGDVTDPYADCGDTCGTFDEADPYDASSVTDPYGDCGAVCDDPDPKTSFTPTTGNIQLVDVAWTDNVGSGTYGRFVGVNLYGKAYYSDDGGFTWTQNDLPNNATYNSRQIAYGNGVFMTLGENCYRSADGLSWTEVSPISSVADPDSHLVWSHFLLYDSYRSAWVITGRSPADANISFKSTDNGSTWVTIGSVAASAFYVGMVATNDILISLAYNYDRAYYSTDLNSVASYNGVSDIWGVVSSQDRKEAYNCGGVIVYGNGYTEDGYNWQEISPSGLVLRSFTYMSDFGLYVATSIVGGENILQSSSDGITWTEVSWASVPDGVNWTPKKLGASTDRVIWCQKNQSIIIAVGTNV